MRLLIALSAPLAGLLHLEAVAQNVQVLPPPVSAAPDHPAESGCKTEPYPMAAIRAEATGQTVITFALDPQGNLQSSTIVKSAGSSRAHKLLDAAAVRSLWTCRFAPPESVRTVFSKTYTWRLEEVGPASVAPK